MMTSTKPGALPERDSDNSELSPTLLRSEMRQVIALTWALTTILSAVFLTITLLLLGGMMRADQIRAARASAVAGLACAGAAALGIGSALVIATRRRLTRVSDVYQEALARAQRQTEALRRSEARFQAFMDHSPASTFIKDDRSRYIYGNRT